MRNQTEAGMLRCTGHRRRTKAASTDGPLLGPEVDEASTGTTQLGELLDATTFAGLRGCAPDSLPEACDAHRIFCIMIDRVPMYPAFYVDPRFDIGQLQAITKLLGSVAGGSKWQFFISPKGSLGSVTPLQALLSGRYDNVRASALAFAER